MSPAATFFAAIAVIVAIVIIIALLADRKLKRLADERSIAESSLDCIGIAALLVVACFWTGVV